MKNCPCDSHTRYRESRRDNGECLRAGNLPRSAREPATTSITPPRTADPFPQHITARRRASDARARSHRSFPTGDAAFPWDGLLSPRRDIAYLQALASAAAVRRSHLDVHRCANRGASIAVRSATPRLPKRKVLPNPRDTAHPRRKGFPHRRNRAPADAQYSRPASQHVASRSECIPSKWQRRTSGTNA